MRRALVLALVLTAVAVATPAVSQDGGRLGYYRHPSLHGDTIVFAAEGDLWRVPMAGGVARRLTTHAEEESHPRLSPDGNTLAFTARYEGPAEVYTMPVGGGLPTRRTWEAESSTTEGWTPDGRLFYSTVHFSTLPNPQTVIVDLDSGAQERVPLAEASEGTFAEDGSFFFVRPAFHNNVTKRYRGGTARNIWKWSPDMDEAVELTPEYDGESHSPMVWEGRVYFVTDRDGTMNLWSMTTDGGDLRQHTEHAGWDVREPELEGGRIVYQVAADLWLYDIAAGVTREVPIRLASDFDQLRERWVTEPMDYLTSAALSPSGDRVVLTARGRVFVAPVGDGRLVRASRREGVRFRDVVFMPDGDRLLALSDETQELEFVTLPANGVGDGERLTHDGTILRFEGVPSPDGEWVAFTDNNNDLILLDVDTGNQTVVSTNREGVDDASWSPDSRWLAYAQSALNTYSQIWLYEVESGERVELTSDRVNSFAPAWHPGGEFLYFLSDRNLQTRVGSPWGPRNPGPYFDEEMEIYEIALRAGIRSPFQPDDELAARATPDDSAEEAADAADEPGDTAATIIDRDGIQRRIRRVPLESGNYFGLAVNEEALLFGRRGSGFGPADLMALPITSDDPRPQTIAERVGLMDVSLDGSKVLVRRGDNLHVIDARPRTADLDDGRVDLSGWTFPIDIAGDWRQIFIDAWRLERDYFYDPGMHGVAWDVTLEKYLALVGRVTTREELSDLIGRVVGELSALHTSVRGGDLREDDNDVSVATLGARMFRDPDAGGYRVDHIYRADPDYPDEWAPLAAPGLDVEAGDVIEAVNGVSTLEVPHLGALLRNQQGRQVLVRLHDVSAAESRDLIVVPTTNEYDLRYTDWEVSRRQRVEEAGEGQLGYLHLRAMGSGDINDFYRQFYPVFDRQGLILDMRRNRGGNIDSIILEKLMRQAWMYWKIRVGRPTWNMQYAFRGHMVMLVDAETASDGEAIAEGFRRLGLGVVIGTRTWGGEIWLSSVNRLSDGGLARAPMMGVYGPEGEWLIEQVGVTPDIEVENLPHATFEGRDAQLEAAIEYLQARIAEDPRPIPEAPPYPDLGFRYPVDRTGAGPQGEDERQR